MTLYLLDTNIISDLIKHPQGKVTQRIVEIGEENVCTSIIVASELRYGCAKKGSKRLIKTIAALLDELAVMPFDVPADSEYGKIRAKLEKEGRPIGGNDLLIAAHARSLNAIVATANIDEFRRVHGLKVENWLA